MVSSGIFCQEAAEQAHAIGSKCIILFQTVFTIMYWNVRSIKLVEMLKTPDVDYQTVSCICYIIITSQVELYLRKMQMFPVVEISRAQ